MCTLERDRMGRSPELLAPIPALETNQDPDLFKASDRLEMGEEALP